MSASARPRVFIVGGGFAGLGAARALAGAPVDVTVVDRRNHHVFQPLLYQVATASLSPADISAPIRAVLRGQQNCEVVLAEVAGVDLAQRRLHFEGGYAHYDYLVLCAGAAHAYFGHDDWAPIAPGLKSIEDATELRRRILLAFESAEHEGSEDARRAVLTFGIVGAGPTGVELAGAIKEIAGQTIPRDYRHIDTRTTRVILFEGGPRLLPTFSEKLSARATRDLERMGVEVRVNSTVTEVTPAGIRIARPAPDGRHLYYARVDRSGLWRGRLGADGLTGEGTLVVRDLSLSDECNWILDGERIIYVARPHGAPDAEVRRLDPGRGAAVTLASVPSLAFDHAIQSAGGDSLLALTEFRSVHLIGARLEGR